MRKIFDVHWARDQLTGLNFGHPSHIASSRNNLRISHVTFNRALVAEYSESHVKLSFKDNLKQAKTNELKNM